MARFSGVVLTQDVGTAHAVSMGLTTASRAAIEAPLGFVTVQAGRTGLAGIGCRAKGDGDPCRCCLVFDVLPLAATRPHADLLLCLGVEVLASGHVAPIPDHQRAHLAAWGQGSRLGGRGTRTGASPLARARSSAPSFRRKPLLFQIVVRQRLRLWGYFVSNPRALPAFAVLQAL